MESEGGNLSPGKDGWGWEGIEEEPCCPHQHTSLALSFLIKRGGEDPWAQHSVCVCWGAVVGMEGSSQLSLIYRSCPPMGLKSPSLFPRALEAGRS